MNWDIMHIAGQGLKPRLSGYFDVAAETAAEKVFILSF